MANDPGLSNDTCIFLEATSGDGGNHDANSVWWLSPDISLLGPVSGLDVADAGQSNPITIRYHRKPAGSNCQFPGDESVTIEFWVAHPSIAMSPRVANSVKRVESIGAAIPVEGDDATQRFIWDLPHATTSNSLESAGHKSLVARVYSSSGAPSNDSFFLPGDQHVVQHSLCVVHISGTVLQFKINTVNPSALLVDPTVLQPPRVKVRAVVDLNPTDNVSRIIKKRILGINPLARIRATPLPAGFRFSATGGISNAVNQSVPGGLNPAPVPSFEAQIAAAPFNLLQINFGADLSGLASGEAYIFHFIQTAVGSGVVQGGLTLVALKR